MDFKCIGKNIQYYRKKAGYTQEKLGELVGVSNTHISHLETGDGNMSLDSLLAIAKVLKTTPDYLLLGTIETPPNRAAQMFMDKTQKMSQDEINYIFDIIDVMNGYKVVRK